MENLSKYWYHYCMHNDNLIKSTPYQITEISILYLIIFFLLLQDLLFFTIPKFFYLEFLNISKPNTTLKYSRSSSDQLGSLSFICSFYLILQPSTIAMNTCSQSSCRDDFSHPTSVSLALQKLQSFAIPSKKVSDGSKYVWHCGQSSLLVLSQLLSTMATESNSLASLLRKKLISK